jgi:hypothetical protein
MKTQLTQIKQTQQIKQQLAPKYPTPQSNQEE